MEKEMIMEQETTMEIMPEVNDVELVEVVNQEPENGNNGKLIVGGLLAALAVAGYVYKKRKDKKSGKTKKQKMKWKLVRVPVETEAVVVEEVPENGFVDEDEVDE